ncbi:hypothetical protein LOTGIDRAFT_164076 [Lottia gigantea]|uniref:Uncharacterized protein n=1 Tax=Lottia gigantea TaxID=225164 RepID=V4BNP1_LOTGI|nr:hypothetical protein LOTGIDRAFT_164076 [Lottia gigantea]ESO90494.1 hypothetical protein LOTGIDRAFT_164076 [Lottia gigantea]
MANKFGLGSLSLETKKSNTTAWINKAKPYFYRMLTPFSTEWYQIHASLHYRTLNGLNDIFNIECLHAFLFVKKSHCAFKMQRFTDVSGRMGTALVPWHGSSYHYYYDLVVFEHYYYLLHMWTPGPIDLGFEHWLNYAIYFIFLIEHLLVIHGGKFQQTIHQYLFSNPKADLPKSITPIIDDEGLLFNGFRIKFRANSSIFKINTKDLIFTLTRGLIDLMNENSLNTLLGFDKRLNTQSTLAPHKANIENDIDVINIHCNLINGGFFNKYKRQIIYSLPTFTVPIGYRIIEKPFQTTYLPHNSFMIKDINLEIKDGKNRFIDFGNEEIVIQLHLKQKN